MSTMIAEVYDALIEAGASPDKARAAAVTLANYDDHFVDVGTKLSALDAKLDARFSQLEAKLDARCNQLDAKFDTRCNQLDARCNQLDFKLNLLLTGYGVAALAVISMMYRIGVKLGALPWF